MIGSIWRDWVLGFLLFLLFSCRHGIPALADQFPQKCPVQIDSIGTFVDSLVLTEGRGGNGLFYTQISDSGEYQLSHWWPQRPLEVSLFSVNDHQVIRRYSLVNLAMVGDSIHRPNFARVNEDGSLMVRIDCCVRIGTEDSIMYDFVIPGKQDEFVLKYYYHNRFDCDPYFNPKDTTLRFCIFAYDFQRISKGAYAYPFVEAIHSLARERSAISPIKRTNLTIGYKYGFATNYYRCVKDSLSIFSWEADPSISIFNHRTNEVVNVPGKSYFDTRPDDLLPRRERHNTTSKLRHLVSVGRYSGLVYHPIRNEYYRFFSAGIDQVREDGLYNTLNDNPQYMQIFDQNFCLMNELVLLSPIYAGKAMPYGKGYALATINQGFDQGYPFQYVYYE